MTLYGADMMKIEEGDAFAFEYNADLYGSWNLGGRKISHHFTKL